MSNAPAMVSLAEYLLSHAPTDGSALGLALAQAAVAIEAQNHPDWDMAQRKTWAEWNEEFRGV